MAKITDNIINEIRIMEQTSGRDQVMKYVEESIQDLERKILDNVNDSRSEQKYNRHDLMRERRKIYKEFKNITESIKEHHEGSVITVKHP